MTVRLLPLGMLAVSLALCAAGCQDNASNVSNIAGHSGPSPQTDIRSSGVGPGAHQPATNGGVSPVGAGPAGSQ